MSAVECDEQKVIGTFFGFEFNLGGMREEEYMKKFHEKFRERTSMRFAG